jgi:OOP family OmpA-OmpF porin
LVSVASCQPGRHKITNCETGVFFSSCYLRRLIFWGMEILLMKKQWIAAAAVCGFALAAIAPGASAEIPLTINGGIGHWYIDDSRDVNDADTPWVGLEWAFNDNWAAEILYAEDDTRLTDGSGHADIATWQVGMLYYGGSYIGKPNRIRPYVAFGAGEIDIDAGFADTVETTLNAGVGIRWMFTRRLGARLETRMLYSVDEHHKDLLMSAGLNYYFGQVQASAPVVVAPVDSDGDGVTDDMDECPNTPAGTRVDSVGCPLPVTQVASIKLLVNFGFDSDVVQEKYFTDLGQLAEFLQRFEDIYVDIEGHTDSVGPEDYNQQLSQRRAQAVVDLLVNEHGIAAQRLEAKGFGESQPVASNDTDGGCQQRHRWRPCREPARDGYPGSGIRGVSRA